jgi:hypothetical protein
VPVVVIVVPVEKVIPLPAVIVVTVPEPPPEAIQDIIPEVSEAKTDVPEPGKAIGKV